jgi:hypothetical protein
MLNMHFREIGRNRYQVLKNKSDDNFCGIVEKHEYVSIDMATGKRVTKRFWKAHGDAGGWRQSSKEMFPTREAAGKHLLKESAQSYATKATHWTKRQGESAIQKATKAGA